MTDKRVDDAAMKLVESIVPPGVAWRYGNYVQSAALIEHDPENALTYLDSFTTSLATTRTCGHRRRATRR